MQVLYVYAFLQIIFEALPISSSGNVLLLTPVLQNLFHLKQSECQPLDFDFLLHLPTLFVLMAFFFKQWVPYVTRFTKHKSAVWQFGLRCALADMVTAVFYYFRNWYGVAFFPLWCGFVITTLLLLSLLCVKRKPFVQGLTYRNALVLGAVQGCALLPGISRLASTYVVGVWLGYSPERSFYYSFLVQIPLIGAAVLKALWQVSQQPLDPLFVDPVFYGIVLSASCVAFCLLWLVFGMVKRTSVWKWAWYTGVVSVIAFFTS